MKTGPAASRKKMSAKRIQARLRAPVARLIGFRVTRVCRGRAQAELPLGKRHLGPGGVAHGGILCDLADAAMGFAFLSTLPGAEPAAATVDLTIRFLRPVTGGTLKASARVVHRGRRLGWIECDLRSGGRLVAKASATCTTLSRPWPPTAQRPKGVRHLLDEAPLGRGQLMRRRRA